MDMRTVVPAGRRAYRSVLVGVVAVVAVAAPGCGSDGEPETSSYRVPAEAMRPTLAVGDRVEVERGGYEDRTPRIGDVAVFRPPAGARDTACGNPPREGAMCARPTRGVLDQERIARIVAGPGARIAMRAGRIVRNGTPERARYAQPCEPGADCEFPVEITVPEGHWYLLGDDRGRSDDSRFYGAVPGDLLVGPADVAP